MYKLGTPADAEFESHAGDGIRDGYFQHKPDIGSPFIIFDKETMEQHERIEIETLLCAIAIELIKSASPYRLREAARIVEIRSYKDRMR